MADHGTRSRYVHGCRCDSCRLANRLYAREINRHHARVSYGLEEPRESILIDATETRDHLAWLRTQGVGRRTISKVSGVGQTTIQEIISGRRREIHPRTADRLLAVNRTAQPPKTLIPAEPTVALLDDLIGLGFTQARIALELGNKNPALQINRKRVTLQTARKVEEVWERLIRETPAWHGTYTGYAQHLCRCLRCRPVGIAYQRERRERKRQAQLSSST